MLVLSRRENEKIVLPELGITLEVVRIQGNTVRIGIEAPREIRIVRSEVQNQPARRSAGKASSISAASPVVAYDHSQDAGNTIRESRTAYQCRRKSGDSANSDTNEMIAC